MRRAWRHLRFMLPLWWGAATLAGIVAGGGWMWTGVALLALFTFAADEWLPADPANPQDYLPAALDALLFTTLPLIVGLYLALARQAAAAAPLVALAGGVLSIAFAVAIAATNVAHELIHRRNPLAHWFGKALLLFSFDVPFVISHRYGHHIAVGTIDDHSTARRGESGYAYIWRSTIGGNRSAWRTESARLRANGLPRFNWRNCVLRGHLASACAAFGMGCIGGWMGAGLFLLCAVLSKSILELLNYIQHYGIVRQPGSGIELRHCWNSDHPVSTFLLFNVTRHSHHHVKPGLPFWALRSFPEAPSLPRGYLTSMCIALFPPWWHRHIAPALLDWDASHATPGERALAAAQNRASGVPRLLAATTGR